ncbi:MAG: RluA family pseudouridine synthase [Burkholderiaceae bacterium]|nr:RluA family pseudouridine synthase [Burkholderiaceae bacterium]
MHSDSHDYSRAQLDDPDEAGDPIDPGECLVIDAGAGVGERLDRFLARMLPEYSRTRLQHWIAIGAVRCDQRPAASSMRLSGFERIEIEPQPLEAERAFVAEPVPLAVVHQDDDLLVIDKPAGLVVHPAAGNWSGTLLNGLLHRDAGQARLPRAGIVHRLDKDTSGLMVVARNEAARQSLTMQLADRTVSRRYLAIVAGRSPGAGSIDAPIGRDPSNRLRMAVVDPRHGRSARTDFRRLALGRIGGREVSLVECRLHTGRTHQIRVHLRSIGHALLGDALYNGPAGAPWPTRQMLHAWRLSFAHPSGARQCLFRSEPPADFTACLRVAGIGEAPTLLASHGDPGESS